jgi:Uma2 family endonuclease
MDSPWHRLAMTLLLDVTACLMLGRQDYYAGGNMFIYNRDEDSKKIKFRGPDYFFIWDVKPLPLRRFWVVWNEDGRFPDVILELASPTTIKIDKTEKKTIYEKKFRTREYFIYDPDKQKLSGWRLTDGRYKRIVPDERGWLWCEELDLWIGLWQGNYMEVEDTYPRFFDRNGQLVPTLKEAVILRAERDRQNAELQNQIERQRTEAEKQRAETEKQRADEQQRRADQAEAELAILRAQQGTNGKRKKP